MTLKEIRTKRGITQAEAANLLGCSIPQFSNYENGHSPPPVEDMITLQKSFNQIIEWEDSIDADAKDNILNAINSLSKQFPLQSILAFVQKCIKQDQRFGKPDRTIMFFARQAIDEEILLPPGMRNKVNQIKNHKNRTS